MVRWLAAALLVAVSLVTPATAQDAVSVVQEHRTRDAVRKTVQHLAVLRNTSTRPVQNLRVTVELYDYFGKLLWARTVSPSPASLKAGDTATLSVSTPDLPDHRQTKYRFQYRSR
jgi:hypothetical protein